MNLEKPYHSYLVRLWREVVDQEVKETPGWEGEVIHIQTGRSWRIHDLKLLSDFLEGHMTGSKPAEKKED